MNIQTSSFYARPRAASFAQLREVAGAAPTGDSFTLSASSEDSLARSAVRGSAGAIAGAVPGLGIISNLAGAIRAGEKRDETAAIAGGLGAALNLAATIAVARGMSPALLVIPALAGAASWGLAH